MCQRQPMLGLEEGNTTKAGNVLPEKVEMEDR